MKLKFNKYIFVWLCAFICLILTIFTIQRTYARYVTSLQAKSSVQLGSWLLVVNEQNIIANSDFSGKISPTLDSNADLFASGTVSPGIEGHLDITIDYSDVTVPFKYKLNIEQDESTLLEDFEMVNCTIDNTSFELVDSTVENTVNPDGTKTSQVVKVNFKWNDDEGLTDIEDTNFSRTIESLIYKVNIEFTQLQPSDV